MKKLYLVDHEYYVAADSYAEAERLYRDHFGYEWPDEVKSIELISDSVIGG